MGRLHPRSQTGLCGAWTERSQIRRNPVATPNQKPILRMGTSHFCNLANAHVRTLVTPLPLTHLLTLSFYVHTQHTGREESESNDEEASSNAEEEAPSNSEEEVATFPYPVGTKIARDFGDDGLFEGTIVQHYDDDPGMCLVKFTDGDQEDLDEEEVTYAIDLYKQEFGEK